VCDETEKGLKSANSTTLKKNKNKKRSGRGSAGREKEEGTAQPSSFSGPLSSISYPPTRLVMPPVRRVADKNETGIGTAKGV
jgi:hypothetical protein